LSNFWKEDSIPGFWEMLLGGQGNVAALHAPLQAKPREPPFMYPPVKKMIVRNLLRYRRFAENFSGEAQLPIG
jgi:hypothetical protein